MNEISNDLYETKASLPKYRKIKPFSDEYNKLQLEDHLTLDSSYLIDSEIFSLDEKLNKQIEFSKKLSGTISTDYGIKDTEQRIKKALETAIDTFRTKVIDQIFISDNQSSLNLMHTHNYLSLAFGNHEIIDYFKKIPNFADKEPNLLSNNLSTIYHFIADNKDFLTNELIIKIAKEKRRAIILNEVCLKMEQKNLNSKFKEKFQKINKKYRLKIQKSRINKILNSIDLGYVDPLLGTLEKIDGSYRPDINRISLSPFEYNNDKKEIIFTHEALHAISGKTAIIKQITSTFGDFDDSDNTITSSELIIQKNGLNFFYSKDNKNIFGFLDEGITQLLTEEILDKKTGYYQGEMNLVKKIVEKSNGKIELVDFYRAYFEDYEPNAKNIILHWKSLQQKIKECYGDNFLNKLNRQVNNLGIEKTLKSLDALIQDKTT